MLPAPPMGRLASKPLSGWTSSRDSPAVPERYPHGSGRPSPAVCGAGFSADAAPAAPTPGPSPWSKRGHCPPEGAARVHDACSSGRCSRQRLQGRASDQFDRLRPIDPAAHQRHAEQVLSGPATRRRTAATTYGRPSQLLQADGATGDEGARPVLLSGGWTVDKMRSDLLTRARSLMAERSQRVRSSSRRSVPIAAKRRVCGGEGVARSLGEHGVGVVARQTNLNRAQEREAAGGSG